MINLSGAVSTHKKVARGLINSSEIEGIFYTRDTTPVISSGAPMFAGISQPAPAPVPYGPFKCTWIDARVARTRPNNIPGGTISVYHNAEIIAKFWLEDVLVDPSEPYGETYADRAEYLSVMGKRYKILGYERFGLGITQPYMLSVALQGSFTSNG